MNTMSSQVRINNADNVASIVTATNTAANGALSAAVAAGVAGSRSYLTGIYVTGLGATSGAAALGTITGVAAAAIPFYVGVPAGVTTPVNTSLVFDPPLPANAQAAAITVAVAAFGTGNTNAAVLVTGYTMQEKTN